MPLKHAERQKEQTIGSGRTRFVDGDRASITELGRYIVPLGLADRQSASMRKRFMPIDHQQFTAPFLPASSVRFDGKWSKFHCVNSGLVVR